MLRLMPRIKYVRPMKGFRTLIHDPWSEWDRWWLDDVRRNARWTCVRVIGLLGHGRPRHQPCESHPDVTGWRAAMRRLLGTRDSKFAPVVLHFRNYPSNSDLMRKGPPFECGNRRLQQWTRTLELSHRLDLLLRLLKAESRVPVLLHVEDFSARWALAGVFRPDVWVMDNPVVGCDEAEEIWPDKFADPGMIRHSSTALFDRWPTWNVHLHRDELVASHLPITGQHGRWTRRQPGVPLNPLIHWLR